MKEGFDNQKYIAMQAERIRERIDQFGGKLYLEFGGKLFDDYHASRVLPGFEPDSKIRMLQQLSDEVEIIVAINASHIEKSKVRGDLGITYDDDVLRLMDIFRSMGFLVGGVVITQYENQPAADAFRRRLDALGIKHYLHYPIAGYPYDIDRIVSDEGYGRNDYIETERPLVVVTAPGPGSGKMATCLSQLYHEHKRGMQAGYAKYETFPVWNLPLKHPVNIAYEAATVDLDDSNIIDPFHLEAYGQTTVNYNRDVEIFPVLKTMFERISGASPYLSPTDMGVNMAGYAITDDEAVRNAAKMEIVRRYFQTAVALRRDALGAVRFQCAEPSCRQAHGARGRPAGVRRILQRDHLRHRREALPYPWHQRLLRAEVRAASLLPQVRKAGTDGSDQRELPEAAWQLPVRRHRAPHGRLPGGPSGCEAHPHGHRRRHAPAGAGRSGGHAQGRRRPGRRGDLPRLRPRAGLRLPAQRHRRARLQGARHGHRGGRGVHLRRRQE